MLTDQEIMKPMHEWLSTYPYSNAPDEFAPFVISYGDVEPDFTGEGIGLRLTSRLPISSTKNVLGEITSVTERVNFTLIIWRHMNEDDNRRKVQELINQLIRWINEEQIKRMHGYPTEMPKFGEDDVISADGGQPTAVIDEGSKLWEFQVGIHLTYKTHTIN